MAKDKNEIEYSKDQLAEHDTREERAEKVNRKIIENRHQPVRLDTALPEEETKAASDRSGTTATHARAEEHSHGASKKSSK